MRRGHGAWASLVAIVLAGAPARAADLAGVVRGASGEPVRGAIVALSGSDRAARSGPDGTFAFASVEPGVYTLTAVFGAMASAPTRAEVTDDPESLPVELVVTPYDRITVTASRIDEPLRESPQSVGVLDREDLRATAALRLDDALRQIPGFTLFRRTSSRVANPTTQGAQLRGIGGSGAGRVLVLDDGVPLNDPFGGWVAWGRVPRLAVERIEVLRGGSSLYGTSALAGVIQTVRRSHETALDVEASYGSASTTDLSLYAAGVAGSWSGSIAGEAYETGGYVQTAPEERGPIDVPSTSRQRVVELSGGVLLGGAGRLQARVSLFDEERGNGTPAQVNATRLGQAALGWDGTVAKGEATVRLYGCKEDYDQTFSSVSADRASETPTRLQEVPSDAIGLTTQWSRSWSERGGIVTGIEASRVDGTSRETVAATGEVVAAGGTQVSVGAFADARARIGSKALVSAGLRFDRWSSSGADAESSWGPRLAARYEFSPTWDATASAWTAFRAPTLNELYRGFQAGGVVTLANPDLGPERLRGIEIGAGAGAPSAWARLEARLFRMEVDDAIVNVTLASDPTGNTRQRQNLARTVTQGIEVDVASRSFGGVSFGAGVLLADATVAGTGTRVPQVPRAQGTLRVNYASLGGMRLGAQARLASSAYEDDRNTLKLGPVHVVDVSASVPLARGLRAFAAVENVLDDTYETGRTPVTTLGAPRTAHAGLRLSWSP